MAELIFGIVGVVTGISGMLCAIIVATRNKKKDDKNEGKEDGVLMTEIGYIKKGVDGIEQKKKIHCVSNCSKWLSFLIISDQKSTIAA